MNRLITCLVAALLFVSFLAWGKSEPQNASGLKSGKKLVFGVIAPRGMELTIKNWRPFTDAMSNTLQIPIEIIATAEYKELVELFKSGKIDIAWLNNLSALEVVEIGKGSVFAQMITKDGSTGYKSVLIVHKDSKIRSLDDVLKSDKKLVFGDGDVKSTSGHLAPLYYAFVKNKVNDPEALFKEIKYGNHKVNAMRTAQKEVDVATNNTEELRFFNEEHPDLKANLRVIWTSPEIPQSPLVWRRSLSTALKRQISEFIINYGKSNEEEQKILLQANELRGFRKSSNKQLITVADLEMFNQWQKLWNDRELAPEEKRKQENLLRDRGSRLELFLRGPIDVKTATP